MSLIVTIYVNDGIIMASDSRSTLTNTIKEGNSTIINQFPLSDSTFKTFLLRQDTGGAIFSRFKKGFKYLFYKYMDKG